MNPYWSHRIKHLKPYEPGEQIKDDTYIKLNTNENPYPPSPKVFEGLLSSANESLRKYPDPYCLELRKKMAQEHQIDPAHIFIGNGSDEVLSFAFMAFFDGDNPILFPKVTFALYKICANLLQIPCTELPMNPDLSINHHLFLQDNGGIVIANPNANTGLLMTKDDIKKILSFNQNSVVIVDEAYIEFGGTSMIPWIHDFPNLLVVNTFSKSKSLAGLRIGYAIGNSNLIQALACVKNSINSYTVDTMALSGATHAFSDLDYYQTINHQVMETREFCKEKFRAFGFTMTDSLGNFILVKHESVVAEDLYTYLKNHGILVRHFKDTDISDYLRISMGTMEEMHTLFDVLQQWFDTRNS